MKTFESLKRCYHCGAVIQNENPNLDGYISPENEKLLKDNDVVLCDSCYKKQRFNRVPAKLQASEDFLTMLKDANASDAMIVNVIDLTSFECSFDLAAAELIKSLKYVIIANKRDLMPEEYTDEVLKQYVHDVYAEYGLNVELDNIFLTSLLSSDDVSDIVECIEKNRQGHDVYIIGDTLSGKSYFLNAFLKNYKNKSNHSVGVSRYFGTNLDVLKIPLDSSSYIYDTPGNTLSNSFTRYKNDPILGKYFLCDKPFISKKLSINEGGSLFISTLARIDLLESDKKVIFSLHFTPKIQTKAITPKANMDALFLKYIQKKALKPAPAFISSLNDYDIFDLTISGIGHQEITISGLGWLSFNCKKPIKLRIYVPKGIGLYAGKAKGHKNKNVNPKE